MYVKIENQQIVEYPYSIQKLREENKNVSFPKPITETVLNSFGVYSVRDMPNIDTHNVSTHKQQARDNPELVDGEWVRYWDIVPLSDEEATQVLQSHASGVRSYRDELLTKTDWVAIRAAETGIPIPSNYSQYRAALRDITTQDGFPFDVVFPVLGNAD